MISFPLVSSIIKIIYIFGLLLTFSTFPKLAKSDLHELISLISIWVGETHQTESPHPLHNFTIRIFTRETGSSLIVTSPQLVILKVIVCAILTGVISSSQIGLKRASHLSAVLGVRFPCEIFVFSLKALGSLRFILYNSAYLH